MTDALTIDAAPDIPDYVVKRTRQILESERLARLLPPTPRRRVRVEAVLAAGLSLAEAHVNWQAAFLETLPGLPPLARQAPDATTPPWIVRVAFECVDRESGGMSSYYGYEGYFVSVLVSLSEGNVWDARLERAR
jgi:hypothetical protein